MESIKTWAPILVPVLALLAGTGWLQYYLNNRRTQRERYRTLLEDFLLPFEATLETTKKIFSKLRDDRELSNLEYHPGRLQAFFTSLPEEDPRKHLWRAHIEWLQAENRRAVEFVEKFYGRIVLAEFRQACDEFMAHAKEWEVVWTALVGTATVPKSLNIEGTLYAPQFPQGLEPALRNEVREVRRRAGQ